MDSDFYNVPYVRFQPFLIGILIAYALYKTKGKEVKIPRVLNLILWQVSLITMFAIIFGPAARLREDNLNSHTWTPFESLVYNCFHKTLWSLALGWIVFSCHKGYGGILNDFLSWECWIPLAKLTFGAYLNHITVQVMVFYGISSPLYLTDFVMVIQNSNSYEVFPNIFFSVTIFHWDHLFHFWHSICSSSLCGSSICSSGKNLAWRSVEYDRSFSIRILKLNLYISGLTKPKPKEENSNFSKESELKNGHNGKQIKDEKPSEKI